METKYIVNNLSGQTINGEPILRPYKVFTALLSQSGTDGSISLQSGNVTEGVTYIIYGNDGDYSNVGAPDNNDGTKFIAINSEVPNSYGTGELKYDPGAPVAIILENTIGNVWFTYEQTGSYIINSDGLFTINKTMSTPIYGDFTTGVSTFPVDINRVGINNSDGINATSNRVNEIISTPIEIRVYN